MCRLKTIYIVLIALALTCGCQTQSYTDESLSSSSSAQRLSSSQPTEARSREGEAQSDITATVVSTRANLREAPNKSGLVVIELEKGGTLELTHEKPRGPWYKVRHVSSGKTGWIHGNNIKLSAANRTTPSEQSAIGSGSLPTSQPRGVGRRTTGSGDTYINSYGEEVPRPRRSSSIPAGASARCRDGTYSFSRNRRGTCSHHGGVAEWL